MAREWLVYDNAVCDYGAKIAGVGSITVRAMRRPDVLFVLVVGDERARTAAAPSEEEIARRCSRARYLFKGETDTQRAHT